MKIVWNDNEKQAELLCKKEQTVCNVNEEWAEVLCKKEQIVWNDNKEWAEFLCKCNQCVLVFSSSQSPVCKCQFAGGVTVDVIFALLNNNVTFL